jgi:pimeloyl-ACP methyl ester carboxylesterase
MFVAGGLTLHTASTGRCANVRGAPWEYWASGRGPRGMLVLGSALSHGDDRQRLMALFASTRRVVSPTYPQYESISDLVDGLARLLDLEGLDRVDVFGDGFGAGLAHIFARRYPERVDRIALAGFGLWSRLRTRLNLVLGPFTSLLTDSSLRNMVTRPFQRLALQAGPERAREMLSLVERMVRRHSRKSILNRLAQVRELFGHPITHRLDEPLRRPGRALLLFANDDPSFSRGEQEALARTWPESNITRFVTGGHLIGLTKAQELERKLDYFFRVQPCSLRSDTPAA